MLYDRPVPLSGMITDPLFYAFAVPAVLALGLSKGGFAGVGLLATPLTSLYLPPLEAAALMLPILICQDAIAVWWYRHDWDAWNLKVMLPGALIGMCIGWFLAARVSDDAIRLMVGFIGVAFVAACLAAQGTDRAAEENRRERRVLGRGVGLHVLHDAGRRPSVSGPYPAAAHGEAQPRRHHHDLFRDRQRAQDRALFRARPILDSEISPPRSLLLPLAVLTNFLGIWLVRVTPTELFYKIAYILVLLVSLVLIWQGLSSKSVGA